MNRFPSEQSYPVSVVIDEAVTLCANNKHNEEFVRGVVALTAALAMSEVEDSDHARWLMELALNVTSR